MEELAEPLQLASGGVGQLQDSVDAGGQLPGRLGGKDWLLAVGKGEASHQVVGALPGKTKPDVGPGCGMVGPVVGLLVGADQETLPGVELVGDPRHLKGPLPGQNVVDQVVGPDGGAKEVVRQGVGAAGRAEAELGPRRGDKVTINGVFHVPCLHFVEKLFFQPMQKKATKESILRGPLFKSEIQELFCIPYKSRHNRQESTFKL